MFFFFFFFFFGVCVLENVKKVYSRECGLERIGHVRPNDFALTIAPSRACTCTQKVCIFWNA